mgnify:CR=1 FL=1
MELELLLSIALGVGLAAACGFRIFVPFTVMSVAALGGYLDLSPTFAWIGTYPALAAFGTATVLEVLAYYIPWLDNLLDTIATPTAVIAGTVATASVVTDMSPLLTWVLAVIETVMGSKATAWVSGFSASSTASIWVGVRVIQLVSPAAPRSLSLASGPTLAVCALMYSRSARLAWDAMLIRWCMVRGPFVSGWMRVLSEARQAGLEATT